MISPDMIYRLILDQGKKRPEAQAILSLGKKALSYRQLSRHIHSTALQLTRLGFLTGRSCGSCSAEWPGNGDCIPGDHLSLHLCSVKPGLSVG